MSKFEAKSSVAVNLEEATLGAPPVLEPLKIGLLGFPNRGKTVLTENLGQVMHSALGQHINLFQAHPDNDVGLGVAKSINPELATKIREEGKGTYSDSHLVQTTGDLFRCKEPLTIVDFGGKFTKRDVVLLTPLTHAIILGRDEAEISQWRQLLKTWTNSPIEILAEFVTDNKSGREAVYSQLPGEPLRANLFGVESGNSSLQNSVALRELAEKIAPFVPKKEVHPVTAKVSFAGTTMEVSKLEDRTLISFTPGEALPQRNAPHIVDAIDACAKQLNVEPGKLVVFNSPLTNHVAAALASSFEQFKTIAMQDGRSSRVFVLSSTTKDLRPGDILDEPQDLEGSYHNTETVTLKRLDSTTSHTLELSATTKKDQPLGERILSAIEAADSISKTPYELVKINAPQDPLVAAALTLALKHKGHGAVSIQDPAFPGGGAHLVVHSNHPAHPPGRAHVSSRALSPRELRTEVLTNMGAMSRTLQGIADTSSSIDKPELLMDGDELKLHAQDNAKRALEFAHQNRDLDLGNPGNIHMLVKGLWERFTEGIIEDNLGMLRSWETTHNQTTPIELPDRLRSFCYETAESFRDLNLNAQEIAARSEYIFDTEDHFLSDACGKVAQALSALILYQRGSTLPKYESRQDYYTSADESWEAFKNYHQSLFV